MEKRNRLEGHTWLKRFLTEPPNSHWARSVDHPTSLGADLMYLTHDLGLYVEISQEAEGFKVRCYPNYRPGAWKGLQFAASYAGGVLKRCVSAAVADYLYVQTPEGKPELVSRETVRWVE